MSPQRAPDGRLMSPQRALDGRPMSLHGAENCWCSGGFLEARTFKISDFWVPDLGTKFKVQNGPPYVVPLLLGPEFGSCLYDHLHMRCGTSFNPS